MVCLDFPRRKKWKRAVNERVMASGDPLDEAGAEAAPDAASVAAALSKALEEYRTANAEAAISIE